MVERDAERDGAARAEDGARRRDVVGAAVVLDRRLEQQRQHTLLPPSTLLVVPLQRSNQKHQQVCLPVVAHAGHTYERREIFRWLCTHNTSPLTGATLPNKFLTPAIALRQLIANFKSEHPEVDSLIL